ncbi:MAG: UPF0721 transmembrane protein [Rhodothermaceae bacterium]|nr:MAG: UPF0721 transmembrane protein [Rhodothermaceae bacterium]
MWIAIIGAVLIGLSLGLLGSGGSILTVPVLIYLVGEPDKVAIAESLGIVAAIAAAGALPYARQRTIDWRSVLYFGVPGLIGTYGGAWLSQYVAGAVQLVLFAVVMLLAAVLMYRRSRPTAAPPMAAAGIQATHAAWKIMLEGISVGVLTGLVGVGGGFLIVPALVLLGGLDMRRAVGTSLVIIALKSLAGYLKYLDVLAASGLSVNWEIVGLFAAVGIAGSFAGNWLGKHIASHRLQKGFAVFLVVMALWILYQNIGQLTGA